jgi:chromosome segregation ATPase
MSVPPPRLPAEPRHRPAGLARIWHARLVGNVRAVGGYGVAMTATHEQRITDLESETFRVGHRLDRLAGATEHLTVAVGELSQGQRGLALDVTEMRRELGEVREAVSRIEREHGELLRAILERLGSR